MASQIFRGPFTEALYLLVMVNKMYVYHSFVVLVVIHLSGRQCVCVVLVVSCLSDRWCVGSSKFHVYPIGVVLIVHSAMFIRQVACWQFVVPCLSDRWCVGSYWCDARSLKIYSLPTLTSHYTLNQLSSLRQQVSN